MANTGIFYRYELPLPLEVIETAKRLDDEIVKIAEEVTA
jgi:hypothetical protein